MGDTLRKICHILRKCMLSCDTAQPITTTVPKRLRQPERLKQTAKFLFARNGAKCQKKGNLKRKAPRQFGKYDDDQLEKKREELKNDNTTKSNKKTEKVFIEYLEARWLPQGLIPNTEYWTFPTELLDKILCKYWFEARQVNNDMYNINSLRSLHYGLNRNLKKRGVQLDLVKSECFIRNQEAFDDACKQLKLLGYGHVKHYDEIKPTDLRTLYESIHLNPDAGPRELQNKVMFDIRYYFCRRGGENIETMTKDTFQLKFDIDTKIAYVKKVKDELTKNHKEGDREIVTGFMPQLLGPDGHPHRLCPVRSFENYIAHLHPDCDRLWQLPKKWVPGNKLVWYNKRPMGHSPIDSFMSDLSNLCGLSQRYTNHCIRVTGATRLGQKFTQKQVMSVTGHKSIESLAIYQRVQGDEKLMMGMWLTYNLLHPKEAIALCQEQEERMDREQEHQLQGLPEPLSRPTTPVLPIEMPPIPQENVPSTSHNEEMALVPTQQLASSTATMPDFDLQAMLSEFQNDNDTDDFLLAATEVQGHNNQGQNIQSRSAIVKRNASPRKQNPQFFNCSIGSINIHIHKN